MAKHWEFHPGVRTGKDRTIGEKAADRMRLGMGTWSFLLGFLSALLIWMVASGFGIDPPPYFRLNLALSMLAGLQGSILLISAKRQDTIAAQLAEYHLEISEDMRDMLADLHELKDR